MTKGKVKEKARQAEVNKIKEYIRKNGGNDYLKITTMLIEKELGTKRTKSFYILKDLREEPDLEFIVLPAKDGCVGGKSSYGFKFKDTELKPKEDKTKDNIYRNLTVDTVNKVRSLIPVKDEARKYLSLLSALEVVKTKNDTKIVLEDLSDILLSPIDTICDNLKALHSKGLLSDELKSLFLYKDKEQLEIKSKPTNIEQQTMKPVSEDNKQQELIEKNTAIFNLLNNNLTDFEKFMKNFQTFFQNNVQQLKTVGAVGKSAKDEKLEDLLNEKTKQNEELNLMLKSYKIANDEILVVVQEEMQNSINNIQTLLKEYISIPQWKLDKNINEKLIKDITNRLVKAIDIVMKINKKDLS